MVSSDTDDYHAILKNKLYQVCTTVAFSYASVVKAGDSSVQVEIQAFQSDLMFKVILLLGILASTLYFVHWYSVRFDNSCKTRALDYLGSELFKSSSIVCACCSPYIPEESVIEMLNSYVVVDEDQFLVFSKAEADGFQCVLASKGLLLLCDNCEFKLFCYGLSSSNEGYVATEISKFCKPFLSRDLSKLVCELDEFGGFILIRLMFKYVDLDYFHGYLNDNLTEGLGSKMQKSHKDFQSSLALSFVFNNISLPISICEAASRQMWATFPLDLLLAFSSHFELIDVAFDDMTMPLEFLVVPDLPQLPSFLLGEPSCRNIKWSHKMQLVAPTLPLPILFALYEFRNGCPNTEKMCGFSLNMKFGFRFNEVMRVTAEMAILDFCLLNNDESVSLTDDMG
ncbi:hypothetical protein Goarm_023296 [Gossypium armourianum]|uniref:Uncharacterized protein n=1 Tax=Gossypium armourianum TaxID=34283 RepID=A0A7J9KHQ6_9ROSI|nr:hypothetical protein [Gossypium armourianum]